MPAPASTISPAPDAARGGEWHDGIEKLMAAPLPEPVAALLAPYLDVIGALNERGRLTRLSRLAGAGARLAARRRTA